MTQNKTVMFSILAVVLAAGAAGHAWALSSRWDRLAELEAERENLQAFAAEQNLADEVAELHQQLADSAAAFPADAEVGGLLSELGDDLRQLGVSERSLTMNTASTVGGVQIIPLDLSFKGSFASAFDLLDRLHTYERIVRVEQIAIKRSPRNSGDGLSINARLLTFAQAEKEAR